MTAAEPPRTQSIQYPRQAVKRAERAVRCAPFRQTLFATMRWQSVALRAIAGTTGVQNRYTTYPLAELTTEDHLLWLIQVGVLRREVDGQGLTDSFRLTPLGRQLADKWQHLDSLPPPSILERLQNLWSRWVRPPGWF